ncbi:MAG: transcription antitermination factor NusB [Flammeovirgaceae bacterium]|nr:transcription antitermination factor NusB [Flammeovirgaceae bacterium]
MAFIFSEASVILRFQKRSLLMLNRRTLRIKIMQSLFAFDQCREANHLLALDLIEERFQPDLNSMEVQNKELLRDQKKIAIELFGKRYKGKETLESPDSKIERSVVDALELYAKQVKKDQSYLSKNIILETEKLSDLYHSVLSLILEFSELATQEKKTNHSNFVNHPLVKSIRSNPELTAQVLKKDSGWHNQKNLVRGWFREVIKEDSLYKDFIAANNPDEESQKQIIKHLVRKLILGAGPINDYFEDLDIRWSEDRDIVKSLTDKTIKSFADNNITLQKLSLDWEDDKDFVNKLFESTINLDAKYKQLIAQNTKNWEVERLPLTDRIILEMALAEMIHFPNIPVKVTINEYIELSKEYSTPKSRQFINVILDVLAKTMKESGAIKKKRSWSY